MIHCTFNLTGLSSRLSTRGNAAAACVCGLKVGDALFWGVNVTMVSFWVAHTSYAKPPQHSEKIFLKKNSLPRYHFSRMEQTDGISFPF